MQARLKASDRAIRCSNQASSPFLGLLSASLPHCQCSIAFLKRKSIYKLKRKAIKEKKEGERRPNGTLRLGTRVDVECGRQGEVSGARGGM